MSSIQVKNLLEEAGKLLQLRIVAGKEGLWHDLQNARYFKAGLILTGVQQNKAKYGIVIFGFMEISYLDKLNESERNSALKKLFKLKPACIIITKDLSPPECLIDYCNHKKTPLLTTSMETSIFLDHFSLFVDEVTREVSRIHGVLVDILGIGVLLQGPSGIGKSEVALELITKGHRLVADDTVEIHKHHPNILQGMGTPVVKHHMEIRGLGIISIPTLFGPSSVRDSKKIEVIIKLEEWNPEKEYERLGLDENYETILDVDIPLIILPVRPGRSIGTIIEVAARDRLLKQRGINSAKMFQKNLSKALNTNGYNALFEEDVE